MIIEYPLNTVTILAVTISHAYEIYLDCAGFC